MGYCEEFAASIQDPAAFWQKQAQQLAWYRAPQIILEEDSDGIARWFVDGELNTSYLALDYHIEQGRGEQIALIYDSPVTSTIKQVTYSELRDVVAQSAGMLQQLGVTKGDRVLIYLPMIPEAAIAMLACARIGAIHSVVLEDLQRTNLPCVSMMPRRKLF
jgi:non-ribosomal peptide synthetase component E (peptide arylation enzyme)